jgi:hypothetical protein
MIEEHDLPRTRLQGEELFGKSLSVSRATGYWRRHIDSWAAHCRSLRAEAKTDRDIILAAVARPPGEDGEIRDH